MADEIGFEVDEMQEIIDDFLIEADELIQSLDVNLVKLETTPDDTDLLNEIFRAAHTIKGTSGFLGFDEVTELTHKMEDILNKLRKAEMAVTAEVMDALLHSLDVLKVLLDNVRQGVSNEDVDIKEAQAGLIKEIKAGTGQGDEADEEAQTLSEEESDALVQQLHNEEVEKAEENHPKAEAVKGKPPTKSKSDQTIRVDVERLDSLMNLMGELVLGRNSLAQIASDFSQRHEGSPEVEPLNQASNSVSFITTELQMAVMRMRMQPVGKVFSKFPRLVRDLARDAGKQIDLIIEGEETELDKSVIEEIGDPLVHCIRNSCDHGVETAEERAAAGKEPRGMIKLSASQEGSNILIKVIDDGKGLNVAAIRDKAVERGLVNQADIDRMPDSEVFRYIFEPGFSTAKKVTDVSGRGVGMDVLRTNIEKLNGLIDLDSKLGHGTTVTIKLPLTLAIVQGLLVESNKEIFILPMASVIETVRSEQADVCYLNQRPVLRLRGEIIPVICLNDILGEDRKDFILTEKPYIVVVGLAERRLGINIDRFLGQEEVVIKSLGQSLGTTQGIAGATILGDGRIRLIVDLIGLFSLTKKLC